MFDSLGGSNHAAIAELLIREAETTTGHRKQALKRAAREGLQADWRKVFAEAVRLDKSVRDRRLRRPAGSSAEPFENSKGKGKPAEEKEERRPQAGESRSGSIVAEVRR